MAEYPSLPFWTDAYISDTQHLTNEEHGVYLRLLMFAWRTPECCLPDNDRRLAIMVGVTVGKWAKLKPTVMDFWDLDGGVWRQKKLTKVRAYANKLREQKRVAGKASSSAKSRKNKNTQPTSEPTAGVTADPTAGQQTKSITKVKKEEGKPSSQKNRQSRIAEGAVISESQRSAANKRRLSQAEAEAQFQRFKNNALAKGLTYLDWDRAFITWLDSPYFKPITTINGGKHDSPGKSADRFNAFVSGARGSS